MLECVWGVLKKEFLELESEVVRVSDLQSFIDYFETEWMSGRKGSWDMSGDDDGALTMSNDLEAWHDALNISLAKKDILWKAIHVLKCEQHSRENDVLKIQTGTDGPPQRRFRKQKEEAISAAKAEYSAGTISSLEFVSRLAHRMAH